MVSRFGKQSQVMGGTNCRHVSLQSFQILSRRGPGIEDHGQLLGLAGQLPQAFTNRFEKGRERSSYPSAPLIQNMGQRQLRHLIDYQRQTHLAQIVPALLFFPRWGNCVRRLVLAMWV